MDCIRALFRAGIVGAALLAAVPGQVDAERLTTATGYPLEYAVRGQDSTGPIALIMMHGKNFPPEGVTQRLVRWAERVAREGFRVYLPVMPWSNRWDGTVADATSAIDALVDLAAKDGKKVVVGGHSMGAMFTILYRPSSLPSAVVGKLISAPGHMLDMVPGTSDFWRGIATSIERAKSLESAGKGKEKSRLEGRNVEGRASTTESYETTPEVYLSWHDPERLPGSRDALKATRVPVHFTVGSLDPLMATTASVNSFNIIPRHPGSVYVVLRGKDHSNSLPEVIANLVPWMRALVVQ